MNESDAFCWLITNEPFVPPTLLTWFVRAVSEPPPSDEGPLSKRIGPWNCPFDVPVILTVGTPDFTSKRLVGEAVLMPTLPPLCTSRYGVEPFDGCTSRMWVAVDDAICTSAEVSTVEVV